MSTLGDDLIEAMSETVAYMVGNHSNTVTHEVRVPKAVGEQENEDSCSNNGRNPKR
jgi:hypothetical protein